MGLLQEAEHDLAASPGSLRLHELQEGFLPLGGLFGVAVERSLRIRILIVDSHKRPFVIWQVMPGIRHRMLSALFSVDNAPPTSLASPRGMIFDSAGARRHRAVRRPTLGCRGDVRRGSVGTRRLAARAFSSAGRAPRLHRGCRRFDPGRAHFSRSLGCRASGARVVVAVVTLVGHDVRQREVLVARLAHLGVPP